MIHLQDEPIADPVCVPVYYVSNLARRHGVIVCQVGEGSDELFWGYPNWKTNAATASAGPLAGSKAGAQTVGLLALAVSGEDRSFPYELLRRASAGAAGLLGRSGSLYASRKQRLLSPRLRRQFAGYASWEALRADAAAV